MLIIVVLLFGICWCPLQLYNILHVTWSDINEYKYINIVWFCSDWLAMSNSCYNPFIYGIYNVNINFVYHHPHTHTRDTFFSHYILFVYIIWMKSLSSARVLTVLFLFLFCSFEYMSLVCCVLYCVTFSLLNIWKYAKGGNESKNSH